MALNGECDWDCVNVNEWLNAVRIIHMVCQWLCTYVFVRVYVCVCVYVRVCILCIVMFLKCQHKFNYQMCGDIFVVIIINIDDHSHYRQVFWSKHFQILYYDQVVI